MGFISYSNAHFLRIMKLLIKVTRNGKLLFILPNGENITATYVGKGTWWAVHTFEDYAVYPVNATYVGLDNVTINNATISISKTPIHHS